MKEKKKQKKLQALSEIPSPINFERLVTSYVTLRYWLFQQRRPEIKSLRIEELFQGAKFHNFSDLEILLGREISYQVVRSLFEGNRGVIINSAPLTVRFESDQPGFDGAISLNAKWGNQVDGVCVVALSCKRFHPKTDGRSSIENSIDQTVKQFTLAEKSGKVDEGEQGEKGKGKGGEILNALGIITTNHAPQLKNKIQEAFEKNNLSVFVVSIQELEGFFGSFCEFAKFRSGIKIQKYKNTTINKILLLHSEQFHLK